LTRDFRKKIDIYYQKLRNKVNFDKELVIKEILVEAKKVSDEMKEKGLVNSPE